MSTIEERVTRLEQALDTKPNVGWVKGKIEAHMKEIRDMLDKHNTERSSLESKFEEHFNAVGNGVNTLHQGIVRGEGRANLLWNLVNSIVRFLQDEVWVVLPSLSEDNSQFSAGTFQARLLACGRRVYEEAVAHERGELIRLRAEKAAYGHVLNPAGPRATDAFDALAGDTAAMLQDRTHVADWRELNGLREEGTKRVAVAVEAQHKGFSSVPASSEAKD